MFRKRLIVDDADFGPMEYHDGTWISAGTTERDFEVFISADELGPTRDQRRLFQRLSVSIDEFAHSAEFFLKEHPDIAGEIGETTLCLCAVGIQGPDEHEWGEFAIELTDADSYLADGVYGVRFHKDLPKTWYIDH